MHIKCVVFITAHTLKQDENIESKVQEVRGKNPSRAKYASFPTLVCLPINMSHYVLYSRPT